MTENELISKIRELRDIKPNKDWVSLNKVRVLGEESGFSFFPYFKPAFATLICVFAIFGLFGFSQNSVPGDFLYSVKKIVEKGQAIFVSEQEKPQASLELANKRLEELTKIAEANQVKKLAPAINEFQASVSEVAKNFSKMEGISSDSVTIKKFVELDKNKQIAEQILATQINTEELDNTYKDLAENLIKDLETRTLTEEKEEILNQMKELAEQEKYSEALELYLINQ